VNRPWRTFVGRIPPENPRYRGGWWVNTKTGECVDASVVRIVPRDEATVTELGKVLAESERILRGQP
jgi:hypothetical protein